jgi:general stress protein YciG
VTTKKRRGFAAMDPEQQREISRRGGLAAHAKGTAHEFTREAARHAGKMGGWVTSRDRQHMARIGRMGRNVIARKERAESLRGQRTEMKQPHGGPRGGVAYGLTILLVYSRSLCRNVNEYLRSEVTQSVFSYRHSRKLP